jgi:ribosomal protein L21E
MSSTVPPATVPVATAPQGGGALKVILIVVGVVVLLGILSIASLGFFAWRMARQAHVHQDGDNVKVDTPFGTVETTKDPEDAVRNLGVDLYPGADVRKNGSSSASFGGVHTATVNAESGDSVDKVAGFYKAKFPNAMVNTSDAGRCTIISNQHGSMVTINIESEGDKTKILITTVSHKSNSSDSSSR